MSIDFLLNRAKELNIEFQKAKQNFDRLVQELEDAKLFAHRISGHMEEVNFQIIEAKKLLEDNASKSEGENEDGKADYESTR